MACIHDRDEQETAVAVDGYCPLCLAAENERLRTALSGLTEVLPKIEGATNGIFSIAAAHGAYYRGPTWKDALERAVAALKGDDP